MTTGNLFGGEEPGPDELTRRTEREGRMKGTFVVSARMPAAHREKHGLKPGDKLPDDWDEGQRRRWLRMSYVSFDGSTESRETAVRGAGRERRDTSPAPAESGQCEGKTKSGSRCKRKATSGSTLCSTHEAAE